MPSFLFAGEITVVFLWVLSALRFFLFQNKTASIVWGL